MMQMSLHDDREILFKPKHFLDNSFNNASVYFLEIS